MYHSEMSSSGTCMILNKGGMPVKVKFPLTLKDLYKKIENITGIGFPHTKNAAIKSEL